MKRAILLVVGLVVLSAALAWAGVKRVPDAKQAAPATAQSQPGQPPAGQAGPQAAEPKTPPPDANVGGHTEGQEQPAQTADTKVGGHTEEGPVGGHTEEGRVGGHAGEAEAAESPWATVARLFNFALLAGSLIYLLRSPFGAFLEGRQAQIRKSLVDAAATREEASRELALIDQKLQALPSELEALKRRGEADIAAEEERIRQAAEAERQRMVETAKREIERRAHVAERQLVQRAGELAVSIATDRVKRTITDADQSRLLDRYLEQVRPETIGS